MKELMALYKPQRVILALKLKNKFHCVIVNGVLPLKYNYFDAKGFQDFIAVIVSFHANDFLLCPINTS